MFQRDKAVREFNSDEILYIRVTNKDAVITEASNVTTSISQYTGSAIPWNSQYYPAQLSQNVLNISTMRETEFGAIPFVAYINNSSQQGRRGEYNSTISTLDSNLKSDSSLMLEAFAAANPPMDDPITRS